MLLQVHGIGSQKITYKDHSSIEFSSLEHYILLAKKSISKFSNQFYQGLASKMLKDEDAISSVATAIMMADWRWDENYQNDKGTKKTKYSYRNQCALWAIQTYVSKNYKRPKKYKKFYSLDHSIDDEESTINSLTKDNTIMSPEEIVLSEENKTELTNLINQLLNMNCLSERQRDYIRLYYFENYTFEKIGKKYSITREAVRQGLNKALDIIRNMIGE